MDMELKTTSKRLQPKLDVAKILMNMKSFRVIVGDDIYEGPVKLVREDSGNVDIVFTSAK